MKIVFNGIMERTVKGCSACGTRRVSNHHFSMTKTYILPSGQTKTFYMGKEEEVSEMDGKFLLSYTYEDQNGTRKAFEEVK